MYSNFACLKSALLGLREKNWSKFDISEITNLQITLAFQLFFLSVSTYTTVVEMVSAIFQNYTVLCILLPYFLAETR